MEHIRYESLDKLHSLNYCAGFCQWYYVTEKDSELVRAPRFFDKYHKELQIGDHIIINCFEETCLVSFLAVVKENHNKRVKLSFNTLT
jgi:hypothetical protein